MKPEGALCRLCPFAFVLGGFDVEFKTEDDLQIAMCKSHSLTQQFLKCIITLITLINTGVITDRLRGNKKEQVQATLALERKKVVELVRSQGTKVRVPR